MYKHILVPTDGSTLSDKAIDTAIQMAKLCQADLTGVNLIQPFNHVISPASDKGAAARAYKALTEQNAREALAKVQTAADKAGVACTVKFFNADKPWKAIIRIARSEKCDLIVMASHGRSGLAGIVLGSETVKVLTHSKIPVLVCR